MKAPPFNYTRADHLAEVFELLIQHGADAKILAGGQSLMPALNMRLSSPALLIDISRLGDHIRVAGTAEITCGDKVFLLEENQSTYIPLGVKHRIRNPGKIPLHIIEVQSGTYLGEDDIVRFEDSYGREGTNT